MTLPHRCLLMSGVTILSVVVVLGGASAQSSTTAAAQDRLHGIQLLDRQPLYDYYNYPVAVPVRPGCYDHLVITRYGSGIAPS